MNPSDATVPFLPCRQAFFSFSLTPANLSPPQKSTEGCAQMLSNTLYGRRFFPYYAFNIVAGLDKDGKGAVYGYDAVGSYQRDPDNATSVGSAVSVRE